MQQQSHWVELDLASKCVPAAPKTSAWAVARVVRSRRGHCHFTVKGNDPVLLADIERYFAARPPTAHFRHTCCSHGPENVARLPRFAVSLIHSKRGRKVAETLRRLNRNVRTVFDCLQTSRNSRRTAATAPP